MSHFKVLVCLTPEEDLDSVDDRLEPYNENITVESYMHDCNCAQWDYEQRVTSATIAAVGATIKDLRETFQTQHDGIVAMYFKGNDIPEDLPLMLFHKQIPLLNEQLTAAWKLHIAEYERVEAEMREKLTVGGPRPNCDSCHGKGVYTSTYNPDSKWDWWTIGGRWDNDLREEMPDLRLEDGNIAPAHAVAGRYTPFAIVDLEGKWHERGSMGWWAVVSDEKPQEDWNAEVEALLKSQPADTRVVLVDCHI